MAPQSPPIGPGAVLAPLFKGYQVSGVLFITICLLVIYTIIMYRSKLGSEIRLWARIFTPPRWRGSILRTCMLAMLLSALLPVWLERARLSAILAGLDRFSPGYGFDGMTVAFLGQGMPLRILVGSLSSAKVSGRRDPLDLFTKIP